MKSIDPKYAMEVINGDPVLVKASTGEAIPRDEPLILFRARDRHASAMLRYYRDLCQQDVCTDFHMAGIDNRIAAFEAFAKDNPERMKQPGITRGL